MSQLAAEIAKALTIAAVQAQPKVFEQNPSAFDATKLGREVGDVFNAIFDQVVTKVPKA